MNANHADQLRDLINSTSIYWIGLAVAICGLALLVHRLRAWYRDGADPADDADEIIDQMEDLKRRGDLSEEEFRSIKSQFSRRADR